MAKLECPIRAQVIKNPTNIAIRLPRISINFQQLDNLINTTVKRLAQRKVNAGDVISICAENTIETIVLMFAVFRVGAIFCPLSHRTTTIEKQQLLQQINCTLAFFDVQPPSFNITNDCFSIDLSTVSELTTVNESILLEPIFYDGDQTSTLLFTSGSSGSPKAAAHSLNNHFFSALGAQSCIPLKESDCWLASLPFNHIGGLAIVFRCFFAGASIALVDRKNLFTTLHNFPITHASMVPTQLYRLLTGIDMTNIQWSLKYLLLGGAPLDPAYLPMLSNLGVNAFYSYGLTEMASQVSTKPVDQEYFSTPLPYRNWKLIDGEIWVSGETRFKGYYVNGVIENAFKDGWFATKDLATKTSEGLTISGRKDNMFICGGENYQPEQVEAIINQSPLVERSVIVPIENDDLGKIAVAFVDWKDKESPVQLQFFLQTKLSNIKIPKHLFNWPPNAPNALKINRQWFSQHGKQLFGSDQE